MLILGIGVLLSGSLLAQTSTSGSDWQSLKILQAANPVFPAHLIQVGVADGEARGLEVHRAPGVGGDDDEGDVRVTVGRSERGDLAVADLARELRFPHLKRLSRGAASEFPRLGDAFGRKP